MKNPVRRLIRILTWCTGIAVVFCAVYIMANRIGLSDQLDFGAGAYYYADIPSFDRYAFNDAYRSKVPTWGCILLFVAWGWAMYRLWTWLESRNQHHDRHSDTHTEKKK